MRAGAISRMQGETKPAILLEGDGMAAVCVARLLSDAHVECIWQPNPRPKLAAILLGEQTQRLLRELFPSTEEHPGDLFESFVRVKRRIVLWGNAPQPLELPHSGVVAPEGELLRRLWERVPALPAYDEAPHQQASWHVQTTRSDAAPGAERSFGDRRASFARVELRAGIAPDACWVESVPHGWLFLLALGGRDATLIAVGENTEALLLSSRLVAGQISGIVTHHASVAAYPRLTETLAGTRHITCGSAAMSFDPLCGEGAGNAVREAFLAAAVIRASLLGHSSRDLSAHYTDRLRRGFLRHLQICLQFYSTGGTGEFWQMEAASLLAGMQDVAEMVELEPAMHFRLVDRDLIPLQAV